MKYSLRKSFNHHRRRRKENSDDDDKNSIYPKIDTNSCSNLVKPIKSKKFLRHQSSSSSPIRSNDKNKSKVFEPRYDVQSDSDDEPFSTSINLPKRSFERLTHQIRKSFRNTLTRKNSNLNKTNNNQTQFSILYPYISTGLTSPLVPTS